LLAEREKASAGMAGAFYIASIASSGDEERVILNNFYILFDRCLRLGRR
jgi:hypothetical protein